MTLLAVMMLASISAFAQSIEHIKGDVNGDGRVNVADIASIIDIIAKGEAGYFYFGNVRPTAENYTSLPGVIGSYTSISEASGATATIAAGETLYMMCPASWMEGKSVELEDESGNPISFLEEKDAITISGYVIYRTQALNDEKTVVLKTKWPETYFSYFGTDKSEKLVEASTGNLKSDIAIQKRPAGCSALADVPSDLQSDGHEYQHLQCARKRKPMVCAYGQTNAGHRLLDDATAVMGHGDTHLTRYQEIYSINIWWYQ